MLLIWLNTFETHVWTDKPWPSFVIQVTKVEVKMAMDIVKHNAPFQMAHTISSIIRECFKDSKIAQSNSSGRIKTTQIINGAVKTFYK